jgi:hypothetical protein
MEDSPSAPSVGEETLTSLVRRVTGTDGLVLSGWSCTPVAGGTGRDVYRFAGVGRSGGREVPWSLVVKVKPPPPPGGDPRRWDNFAREIPLYRSGLLDTLPDGLTAPRPVAIIEHPDGSTWLWLEELVDEIGPRWPLGHYPVAADHLGRFNGAFVGRASAQLARRHPWLASRWLRGWVEHAGPPLVEVVREPRTWEHPLLRTAYVEPVAPRLLRLWAERELFLGHLERLPRTLCHGDAFRRNLFARAGPDGRPRTVAIDWEGAGVAALGEDLGGLVGTSLLFLEADHDRAWELFELAFEGYLEGVRSTVPSVQKVDPRQVRFAAATAAALRWAFHPGPRARRALERPSARTRTREIFGLDIEELVPRWAAVTYFLLDLADEARQVMAERS